MKSDFRNKNSKVNKVLINQFIPFKKMQVIDQNNKSLKILTKKEALELAKNQKLDLLCINDNPDNPICKILDYGKYCYEREKKRKKTKKSLDNTKEIRITPSISDWDLLIKSKRAKAFLMQKMKVKISMRLRGRESQKANFGLEKIKKLLKPLETISTALRDLRLINKCYTIIVAPLKNKIDHEKNKNENQKIPPQENKDIEK